MANRKNRNQNNQNNNQNSNNQNNKRNKNCNNNQNRPWCTYCQKSGHAQKDCKNYPKNKNQNQNQNRNQKDCYHRGSKTHISENCLNNKKKDDTSEGHHNGLLISTPFQLGPPELEALWCRWCNSVSHSTVGCSNLARQLEIELQPDISDNFCDRCAYKGHARDICCNPYPDLRCVLCQNRGHSFKNCLRNEDPQVRKIVQSASVCQSELEIKKDNTNYIEKSAIQSLKRKREALEQTKRACNTFISNLVNATTQKTISKIVPVSSDYLLYINNDVLNWTPGQDSIMWGRDLSQTIKSMQMFYVSEKISFCRIAYALHRLGAGFSIHCAHQVCPGQANIITPDFEIIKAGSRREYLRHEPEHAVFLAYNCTHEFPAFRWTRFRTQEADMTPLHLLQQAPSNPIFAQFTELNAGIGSRDSELEWAASLELEKDRETLAEQQKLLHEKAEKLAQGVKEVKQYARRLHLSGVLTCLASPSDGLPMQLSTPVASKTGGGNGGFPPSPLYTTSSGNSINIV